MDQLNRLVIPMELVRTQGFIDNQPLEIFVDGDKIVLKKYQHGCMFCGSMEDLVSQAGKDICPNCIKDLAKQAKLDQATLKRQVL